MPDRCQYEFDIEIWEEEHDRPCELDSDEAIVDGGVWHCPHEAVEGHDECIFHLPPEDRSADASEAFVAAVEGDAPNRFIGAVFPNFDLSGRKIDGEEEVDLRHARVGDLDWSDANVDAYFDASGAEFGVAVSSGTGMSAGSIDFKETTIAGFVFRRATFREQVTFHKTEFGGDVNFQQAKFEDAVYFREVEFGGKGLFHSAVFKNEVSFADAEFEGNAIFGGAKFGDAAIFRRANFQQRLVFGQRGMLPFAPFLEPVDFSEAIFGTSPEFVITYFHKNGWKTQMAGLPTDIDFSDAKFHNELTLPKLHTFGDLNFSNTNLQQANFRDADLSNANFEDANLSRAALYGTDLTNAKLYGTRLTDARINDATDFGIRGRGCLLPEFLPWVSPSPDVIYDPRTKPTPDDDGDVSDYTRAATVYSELESLALNNAASKLASKCFAWRKDMQRKRHFSNDGNGNSRDLPAWIRALALNVLMRYGESPLRVLGLGVLIVIASGLAYDYFDLLVATGENPPPDPNLLDALYFSTLTFTTLGMGDYRPANVCGRVLAIGETILGVILLALLVFVVGRRATR